MTLALQLRVLLVASSRRRRWTGSPIPDCVIRSSIPPRFAHQLVLLITGRNHHSAGFGESEQSTGFPGYNSIIAKDKATVGRMLRDNGFATSWFGKADNTPTFSASQVGPFICGPLEWASSILWIHRRRHQPVGAEPISQHYTILSLRWSAGLEPDSLCRRMTPLSG